MTAPLMLRTAAQPLQNPFLARWQRPLRFALVGGVCGVLQLLALIALKLAGMPGVAANIAAYLVSAQLNFVLSYRFIWDDRRVRKSGLLWLTARWLRFHASIAATFLISQAVFLIGRSVLHDVAAAALGLGISAVANFLLQDRFTFNGSATSAIGSEMRRILGGRRFVQCRRLQNPDAQQSRAVKRHELGRQAWSRLRQSAGPWGTLRAPTKSQDAPATRAISSCQGCCVENRFEVRTPTPASSRSIRRAQRLCRECAP